MLLLRWLKPAMRDCLAREVTRGLKASEIVVFDLADDSDTITYKVRRRCNSLINRSKAYRDWAWRLLYAADGRRYRHVYSQEAPQTSGEAASEERASKQESECTATLLQSDYWSFLPLSGGLTYSGATSGALGWKRSSKGGSVGSVPDSAQTGNR